MNGQQRQHPAYVRADPRREGAGETRRWWAQGPGPGVSVSWPSPQGDCCLRPPPCRPSQPSRVLAHLPRGSLPSPSLEEQRARPPGVFRGTFEPSATQGLVRSSADRSHIYRRFRSLGRLRSWALLTSCTLICKCTHTYTNRCTPNTHANTHTH